MAQSFHDAPAPLAPRDRQAWIAFLTLLSALFLAWSGYRTLGPTLVRHATDPSVFTLRVPGAPPDTPPSAHHDVVITSIIADGVQLRWNDVVREGTWREGAGRIPELIHRGGEPPAAITFRASSAVVCARTSLAERVLLERDGKPVKEVSLRSPDLQEWRWLVVFESEDLRPPLWAFWAFLGVATGVALWLRPWASGRTGDAWIFFHAAVLHALVWATQLVGVMPDSWSYVHGFENFLRWGRPGPFPPGTSLLIELSDLLPGGALGTKVTLIQHAMFVLSVLWIYRLLRSGVAHGVAFLFGLILGSSWFMLFVPQQILSEPLTCFGMTGAVYFGARYRDSGSLASAILAGVLAGWAGLARLVPIIGAILAFFCLHLLPLSWRGLRRFALVTTIALAVMAAPVAWCWVKSGEHRLTNSEGCHIFNRVVEAQGKLAEGGPMTHLLYEMLDYQDPRGRDVWETYSLLWKKGLQHSEISELLRRVAMEAIYEAPGEFVLFTLEQAWRQYRQKPWQDFAWGSVSDLVVPEVECPPVAGFTMTGLLWGDVLLKVQDALWKWCPWLALAGMALLVVLRRSVHLLAMSFLVLGHLVGTAAGAFVLSRYSKPIVPFVIALAAVPLDFLVRSARRRARIVARGPTASG